MSQIAIRGVPHLDLTDDPSQEAVWPIRLGLRMLNHGSYGVSPAYVLRRQRALADLMNADPMGWYLGEAERRLDGARRAMASMIGCEAEALTFARNATVATAAVLQSLGLRAGDEVVLSDHEYQATFNELGRIAAQTGAVARVVPLPLSLPDDAEIVRRHAEAITPRTRLIVMSHITSVSSSVMPVGEVCRLGRERGVAVLIDGAHAPGQIGVDVRAMGPTYYVGNGHKWLCGPKGSGFIAAEATARAGLRPVAMSARTHAVRADGRPAFLRDFDYVGTDDTTPWIAAGDALEHMGFQDRAGWAGVQRRNAALMREAVRIVGAVPGVEVVTPASRMASMATLRLPADPSPGRPARFHDALSDALYTRHGVQAPVWCFAPTGARVIRISAQIYNTAEDYAVLADALREELARERA